MALSMNSHYFFSILTYYHVFGTTFTYNHHVFGTTLFFNKKKEKNYLSIIYILSKSTPVPSATQVSGLSATNTGTFNS